MGYVDKSPATIGNWQVGAAINSMSNRIAVAYSAMVDGRQSRVTTSWLDDVGSQLEYGIRELLVSNSGSTAAYAEYARLVKPDQNHYPQATVIPVQSGAGSNGGFLDSQGLVEYPRVAILQQRRDSRRGYRNAGWGDLHGKRAILRERLGGKPKRGKHPGNKRRGRERAGGSAWNCCEWGRSAGRG